MSNVWDHEDAPGSSRELTTSECWELLRASEIARLAYRLADEVHLTPISLVVDGDRLVFRTAEGSKLLGVHMGSDVVVEVDRVEGDEARSVVARGPARVLAGAEEERADALPLAPWSSRFAGTYVQIVVTGISGRLFHRRHDAVPA